MPAGGGRCHVVNTRSPTGQRDMAGLAGCAETCSSGGNGGSGVTPGSIRFFLIRRRIWATWTNSDFSEPRVVKLVRIHSAGQVRACNVRRSGGSVAGDSGEPSEMKDVNSSTRKGPEWNIPAKAPEADNRRVRLRKGTGSRKAKPLYDLVY